MDDEAEQVATVLYAYVPVNAEIVAAGGLEARLPGHALARVLPDVQGPAVINPVRAGVMDAGRPLRRFALGKSVGHTHK